MQPYQRVFESFNSDKIVFSTENPDRQKFYDLLKDKGIQFANVDKSGLSEFVFDNQDWPRVQDLLKSAGIKPDGTKVVLLGGPELQESFKPYKKIF